MIFSGFIAFKRGSLFQSASISYVIPFFYKNGVRSMPSRAVRERLPGKTVRF
ncbi:hypothetical protein CLOSTASPAR_03287 [[Clostridium] asparagiforme DSM 15981]|uniref:Uncharacterized protein n=1 Tax=[Clostridium] asparagiforme DSM 15981 TaxID=518636 RepID=C0D1Z7_9FIRM|nr:hypothetical protein CLOSTASPAR_03287 [[Clostridium] asparagiforme DSM 15981]